MNILWAPWRIDYILGEKPDSCVFCLPEHVEEDEERLILYRGTHTFIIMNKFPYNNGHIMVTPYKHVSDLALLSSEELCEMMQLIQQATGIIKKAFNAQGMNVGLNLGEAAGAGIREHLHFHIVPRWNGDSSFMAVMQETRVIPQHLHSTYTFLKPYFSNI